MRAFEQIEIAVAAIDTPKRKPGTWPGFQDSAIGGFLSDDRPSLRHSTPYTAVSLIT